jgi:hypothetical protein
MNRFLPLLLLFSGCTEWPESVGLFGVVTDAPYDEGEALEGLTVTTMDETLTVYSEATTGSDGSFYADIAAAQSLFVEVAGEGYVTTHFGGASGIVDLDVGAGVFFTVLEDDRGLLVDDFEDCVSDDETSATIVGEARLYLMGIAAGNLPEDPNVTVSAYDPDGNNFPACYLDEDGVYDAEADFTGDTGRFGIFGAPAGPLTVEMVSWIQDSAESEPEPYGVYYYLRDVSEGGIAPLYPALTES